MCRIAHVVALLPVTPPEVEGAETAPVTVVAPTAPAKAVTEPALATGKMSVNMPEPPVEETPVFAPLARQDSTDFRTSVFWCAVIDKASDISGCFSQSPEISDAFIFGVISEKPQNPLQMNVCNIFGKRSQCLGYCLTGFSFVNEPSIDYVTSQIGVPL